MKRREFIKMAALGALTQVSGPLFGASPGEKPNFLFVIADDCTFRDIGCYGGQAHTPNIDRLASEGMRFTQCFQAAPMCSPTRHNIYTGLYPVKSGAYPNHTFVKQGTQSVVHYLKPLGYRVALSGKKHINPPKAFPFEYSGKGRNPEFAVLDRFIGECRASQTPFCVFACSNEPHTPWNKGDPSRYDAAQLKLPPYFVDTPKTREAMTRYLAETYVFGEMTTRGIINGSEHFGIRSIRSAKFKYVLNFTPETRFQNACTQTAIFRSWREKAKTDPDAADKVRRYEWRAPEELYDITQDPYEWHNLADRPEYAQVKADLHARLLAWMEAMGDKGQQTELEAFEHQYARVKKNNR